MTRRGLAGAIAVLVVAAVAFAVVGGVFAFKVHAAEQEEARRQAILYAAGQEAVNLMSLSYKTLDRDVQRILDGATGQLEKQFASREEQLKKVVPQVKAVTTGEVLSAGIVSADQDSAQVLLVVDQTVRNGSVSGSGTATGSGSGGQGVVKHYRMSMTLQHKDGRWLVSQMEFL